jgi:isopenicillin-N N-acyltransferase-like protein
MKATNRFLPPLLLLLIPCALAAEPFRYPEAKHGKGELRYVNGLPVLRLEGTPAEIAEQEAALAIKPSERLLSYPKDILAGFGATSMWPWFIKIGTALLEQFPADHRAELESMNKAGVDRELLIAGNTMFDIKKFYACSALIVESGRSASGGPLFGRNLDFPTAGYLHEYSLVKIYRPTGKHAFVSVGFPGLIGCLSGMNDAGLTVAVLEVFAASDGSKKFDETGTPYALCYRRILEECTTVEEAEKLLRSMKRTTRMNLAVCDRRTSAVFEMTPKTVAVRRAVDGVCPCTNHFIAEGTASSIGNAFRTRDRLKTLEAKGEAIQKFDLAGLHKTLDEVNQKHHTLQTMIFEPATLKLHLAIGECPSSALPLKTLELKPLFGSRD